MLKQLNKILGIKKYFSVKLSILLLQKKSCLLTIFCKTIISVVHNGTNIIRTKHIDLVRIILLKFFPPALLNIVPVDADVVISVWTIVFMPQPQCVYQLVDYSVSKGRQKTDCLYPGTYTLGYMQSSILVPRFSSCSPEFLKPIF